MRACLFAFVAAASLSTKAQSNIDPAHATTSSDWMGAIHWLPSIQSGAVINQYYAAGYIHGSSVGWISLGSGVPANGLAYGNGSSADFGVNVAPSGDLSGFAYGANIGWINFAAAGHPRIDWNTGKLSGSVWAANAGWISLAEGGRYLRIEGLPDLPDSDEDGLPDAWELEHAGALNVLSANGDLDRDGQTDYAEYLAGTDPFDPGDALKIITLSWNSAGNELSFLSKSSYIYQVEQHPAFGSGIWSAALAEPIVGTGSEMKVHLESNPSHLHFYRLAAYPPLTTLN